MWNVIELFTFFTFMDFKHFIKVRFEFLFAIQILKVLIILNFNISSRRWAYLLNWIQLAPIKRLSNLVELVDSTRVHLADTHWLFSWLLQDNLISIIIKSFNQIRFKFYIVIHICIFLFFNFGLLFNLLLICGSINIDRILRFYILLKTLVSRHYLTLAYSLINMILTFLKIDFFWMNTYIF